MRCRRLLFVTRTIAQTSHLLSLRAAGAWDIELARAIGYPWDEDSDVDVIEQQVDAHRRYAYRSQLEDVVRRHWRQIGDASTQVDPEAQR